jgi:uncharacterized membrane protein
MSRHQLASTEASHAQDNQWLLCVVRGTKLGQSYSMTPGETIVGNALDGGHGLNLTEQEVGASRRMAARHAAITSAGQDLSIRDLESPGGTFVNRQRILSGQSRRLEPGDVIQLGGVQLEVKRQKAIAAPAPPAPVGPEVSSLAPRAKASPRAAQPGPEASPSAPRTASSVERRPNASPRPPQPASDNRLSAPFTIAGGAQCRTWDDFLVHAAQDWRLLRDELTSGRLSSFLTRIQRADLIPRPTAGRSADDQLDDWLARLPLTHSSAPELDVHPETVLVKAMSGGGITRQTIRVTNVGYRLLKCTAKVDPPGTRWLRLTPEQDSRPFQTIDETELSLELELPESIDRPLTASVVIDGNGGTRRVTVRVERPAAAVVVPDVSTGSGGLVFPALADVLKRRLARFSLAARVAVGCAVLIALRLLAVLANVLPFGPARPHALEPRLSPLAIVLALAGALVGCVLALRRPDERNDLAAAGFAGAAFGLLGAGLWFAAIQSVERALGSWSTSLWAVALCWGLIGTAVAALTTFLIPYRSDKPGIAP